MEYRLFSYNEALVALYLLVHDSYTLPSLGVWLPSLENLPFVDYFAKNAEDLNASNKEIDSQLSPNYIRKQLLKCEDRSGVGFLIVSNRAEFTKFIKKYIAWYEAGKEMYNPSNCHLYQLSYNHTVELLNRLSARFGKSFILTENELAEIESEHDRWIEILLSLHLKGYISIQPRVVSIITREHILIDPPAFSIEITILKPLEVGAKVLNSYCGIQITDKHEVFYKGYSISMKPNARYFKFLEYLVASKGQPRTPNNLPNSLVKAHFVKTKHNNKQETSSVVERFQQMGNYIMKEIFEPIAKQYGFTIDFVIRCGKENVSIQPIDEKSLRNKK